MLVSPLLGVCPPWVTQLAFVALEPLLSGALRLISPKALRLVPRVVQ